MSRRYSDVKRGAQLNSALQNYITWLQNSATRPRRIGTQGPRDLTVTAYVSPFTAHVQTDEVCLARCTPDSYSALNDEINAATHAEVTNALGTKNLISLPKFRAARVVAFVNTTRTVTVQTSEVTGTEYLKYTGSRYSCPFGATADADDQMEAFLEIKAALLVSYASSAVKRFSLSREYVGVEAI